MIARTVTTPGTSIRTCIGIPEQCQRTGKWSSRFETWNSYKGEDYKMNEITSAPVFETEQQAYDGAYRALDVLEKTDKFPNMCEVF